ncbi:nitroreductase [Hyphobacterium marinum]|uniref:Nitroreductase n=1 Tax=Hyphobacterium marinum TaxID=3116574 RepID=A0ABU7M1R7_9PROT|nr:nitroreductase [Hyphobacterium sp. Y6023]MEE2567616.1 nitroreductase [Hyphobacterium sp. Y6023]
MEVRDALRARYSARAFLDTPVSEETIRAILADAARAPSGGNLQPWLVNVVTGKARRAVIDAVQAKIAADPFGDEHPFPVYPEKLWEPYRSRRFDLGEQMYAAIGIPRENKPARLAHLMRNLDFFGAPMGLIFSLDRKMNPNQWAHLGMFMLAVSLAAQDRGLATCMQEAWTRFSETLRVALKLPEDRIVYCGMALGFADTDAPINQWRSERADVDEFAKFEGFGKP